MTVAQEKDGDSAVRRRPLDVSEAEVRQRGFLLWLGWTLVTALAMIIGLLPFLLFAEYIGLGLARILVPIVAGFFVGVLQWLVLRPFLTHSADWILHGGAGWSMGYALGLLIVQVLNETPLGAFIGYIVFGAIIATVQWPVLRREIRQAAPWVVTNVVAWALGSYAGQLLLNLIVRDPTTSQVLSTAVISGTTGLVAGALTGAALVWTVRLPERELRAGEEAYG
jgi:hypothetical protein